MKFSQHEDGDGHWQSRYRGPGNVVERDYAAYRVAKDDHQEGDTLFGTAGRVVANTYRDALFTYASTVYSARMMRPIWSPWTLFHLVDEIDQMTWAVFTSSQKECLMAFNLYLTCYDRWFTTSVGRVSRAIRIGHEILFDEQAPLATQLLVHARLSRVNDYLSDEERDKHRSAVLVALAGAVHDSNLHGLAQEWKTICRLGMLVRAWEYVELAHQNDNSLDLRLKAWVQPGFVWYKVKEWLLGG